MATISCSGTNLKIKKRFYAEFKSILKSGMPENLDAESLVSQFAFQKYQFKINKVRLIFPFLFIDFKFCFENKGEGVGGRWQGR